MQFGAGKGVSALSPHQPKFWGSCVLMCFRARSQLATNWTKTQHGPACSPAHLWAAWCWPEHWHSWRRKRGRDGPFTAPLFAVHPLPVPISAPTPALSLHLQPCWAVPKLHCCCKPALGLHQHFSNPRSSAGSVREGSAGHLLAFTCCWGLKFYFSTDITQQR